MGGVLGALGSCAALSSCASCASSLAPVVSEIRHIVCFDSRLSLGWSSVFAIIFHDMNILASRTTQNSFCFSNVFVAVTNKQKSS